MALSIKRFTINIITSVLFVLFVLRLVYVANYATNQLDSVENDTLVQYKANYASEQLDSVEDDTVVQHDIVVQNPVEQADQHVSPTHPVVPRFFLHDYTGRPSTDVWTAFARYQHYALNHLPPHQIKMILYTPDGHGIGNRFDCLQCSVLLAMITGRVILISWPDFKHLFEPPRSLSWDSDDFPHILGHSTSERPLRDYFDHLALLNLTDLMTENKIHSTNCWIRRLMQNPYHAKVIHSIFTTRVSYYLFKEITPVPVPEIMMHVNKTKTLFIDTVKKLKSSSSSVNGGNTSYSLMTIHLRTGHELEFGISQESAATQLSRTIECIKYFSSRSPLNQNTLLYYIATDSKTILNTLQIILGQGVTFYSNFSVAHFAFTSNIEELQSIIYDWWMLGEGDWMILTAASTFSEFAAYRQGKRSTQYIMGGKTTCSDPTSEYYLETARNWEEHIWPSDWEGEV